MAKGAGTVCACTDAGAGVTCSCELCTSDTRLFSKAGETGASLPTNLCTPHMRLRMRARPGTHFKILKDSSRIYHVLCRKLAVLRWIAYGKDKCRAAEPNKTARGGSGTTPEEHTHLSGRSELGQCERPRQVPRKYCPASKLG